MTCSTRVFGFLSLALAGLVDCSSKPPAEASKPAPHDKIHGRAQIVTNETTASDTALNAGGPSVYLVDGLNRYRLFVIKPVQVDPGKEYTAEGVYAQKAIDAIGDPDQGKNGYPLDASCDRVVRMAWPGLSFDLNDSYSASLRNKIKRFPARAVFLVTDLQPAAGDSAKDNAAEEKEAPAISVPADKQKESRLEGPTTLTAPLWEPAGGTATCKVLIDEQGKIAELNSGSQLCESVPWSQFRYKPALKGGKPARVSTEVEVRFDARK